MKTPGMGDGIDDLAPKVNGRLIGHELAVAGIFDEDFSQFAVRAQVPENIAAGAMIKTGNGAEDFSLGSFAGARRAKHENRTILHASLCLS